MAAPTRNLFGTATTGATNSDTLTVAMATMASGALVGDCICVFVSSDGGQTQSISSGAGWSKIAQINDATNAVNLAHYRFMVTVAGTVPDLVVDMGATTEMAVAHIFRVRPSTTAKMLILNGPTTAQGSSTNPNPPALTNSSGATRDIYNLAVWGGDGNNVLSTVAPTNYANHQSTGIANNAGSNIGSADRTRLGVTNGTVEDPATFTRATEQWAAMTLGLYEVDVYSLTANNLAPSSPALASPALTQSHSLAANALATGSPVLDSPTLSGGGGGSFAPSSLYGVGDVGFAWNPTDLSKVWQNNDGTGAGAFTSPVGRIDDISGLNNHPVGFTTTRPVLQNVSNGMMKFDGVDDILTVVPCLWAGGAGTVIMAVKGPSQDGKFLFAETNSAASGAVYAPGLRSNINQDVLFYNRNDAFGANAVNKDINVFDDTLKTYAIVDDGSVVTFYVNGVSVATHNYTSRAALGATTINQAHIGNAMVGGLAFDNSTSAYVGAGIVIDRALNSTELADAVAWVTARHSAGGVDSLTANNLATGSPALDSPVLTQTHSLTGNALATGAPALGTPVLTQAHSLTANGLAPASPALASPALTQSQVLSANNLATGAPALGTPTVAITVILAANGLATGSPALGSPAIGQVHSITANALATTSPALGSPLLAQVHSLSANGLATSAPALASPALTQSQALTANPLVTASPGTGSPSLTQQHSLAANSLATASPDLGTPTLATNGSLIANNLVTSAPALGSPALGQRHSLTADSLATSPPVLDQPVLQVTRFLVANDLATSPPALGQPALTQAQLLQALDLETGSPALGSPPLGQVHLLVADDLVTGSPDLGTPALNYVLVISSGGRVTVSIEQGRVTSSEAPSRLSSARSAKRSTSSDGPLRVSRSSGGNRNV